MVQTELSCLDEMWVNLTGVWTEDGCGQTTWCGVCLQGSYSQFFMSLPSSLKKQPTADRTLPPQKAGNDSACLESRYWGRSWGRRITVNSVPIWPTEWDPFSKQNKNPSQNNLEKKIPKASLKKKKNQKNKTTKTEYKQKPRWLHCASEHICKGGDRKAP